MLVTFTTKAYADITMFGDVALAMLKMMGHSATVPSAINAESAAPPAHNDNAKEATVSMAHRAMPLIKLLTAAAKENTNVMWK